MAEIHQKQKSKTNVRTNSRQREDSPLRSNLLKELVTEGDPSKGDTVSLFPVMPQDLPGILRIETLSFPSPWSLGMFLEELSNPFSHARVVKPTASRTVAGYIFYQTTVGEMHILNIAVHPSFRYRGIGTVLMLQSLEHVRQSGLAHFVFLEVRENNLPAFNLYKKLGFISLGIRKNYYVKEKTNAIIMGRSLA